MIKRLSVALFFLAVPLSADARLGVTQLTGFNAGGAAAGQVFCGATGIIADLGLSGNLHLCFDAGDGDSYDGSAQTWTDVSGNADFTLGADTASSTDDPTFNGTSNARSSSEYFTNDAGDFFEATANSASMNAMHHDGAAWTLAWWEYRGGTTAGDAWDSMQGSNVQGSRVLVTSNTMRLQIGRAGGDALFKTGDNTVKSGEWAFYAISVDENGGSAAGFARENNAYYPMDSANTWDPNYTSPGSGNANADTRMFETFDNTSRIGAFFMFTSALTADNLDDIYDETKSRFGL